MITLKTEHMIFLTVEPVFWNWRNQKCTSLLKSLSMCRMLW